MGKDCACVYYNNGKCKKFSDDKVTSWCIEGPCKDKTPSNADRIRAMSDEELADNWMCDFVVCHRCAYRYECECDEYVTYEKCKEGIMEWFQQPAEEWSDG